jgi:hypothetical protein
MQSFLLFFGANKKPAAAETSAARAYGSIGVSLELAYPIVRRGAQQHAQQTTGMEHRLMYNHYTGTQM